MSNLIQHEATIGKINQLHFDAIKLAGEAVSAARQIGNLLLEVKRDLPHGLFGSWIEDHLSISVRQAQRYMALAQGKKISLDALNLKNDKVSHLISESEFIGLPAHWIPEAGHRYIGVWMDDAYWVVPDIENPTSFHVSKLYSDADDNLPESGLGGDDWDGNSFYRGTRHPLRASHVEGYLQLCGLPKPSSINWTITQGATDSRPFGEPQSLQRGC